MRVLLLLLLAGQALAAPVDSVTWLDLVDLVDRHPLLAAGALRVEAARAGVEAAGAVPNPTLEGNVGRGLARVGGASTVEWGLALSVPLGWLAGRAPRVDEAGAEVDVALAEARALRRDVVIELRTLFWRLAGEQARVASLEAQEEETRALVRAIERRALAGEVRPVEVTRVEIELEKVAGELEAARIARSARQAELSLWLCVPESSAIVAVADLDSLPVAMDRVLALEKARATSPALQAAGAKTRALEAAVVVEERARVPSFAVSGFTASELDRTALGVGVAVDLPFWNWNTGRLREAEARLAAGRRLAGVTAREVQVELIDAQAACSASVATATRLSANVVPRSEAAAATMEKAYQLGEASLLEVIDVRRTLLDARRQHVNAIAEAHIDCSRLDALVGEESE